jgi:hypothetical protein
MISIARHVLAHEPVVVSIAFLRRSKKPSIYNGRSTVHGVVFAAAVPALEPKSLKLRAIPKGSIEHAS